MIDSYALRHAVLITLASVLALPALAGPTGDPDLEDLVERPLGYAALAIEQGIGADVTSATEALDRVVQAVRPHLPARTPEATLDIIAEAAMLACPTLVEDAGDGLFSSALREGRCDCDVLVTIYLTVADVLDLPLAAVFLPSHALVVWGRSQSTYWETTAPGVRPAWLVREMVPEGADRTYLRPQSRRDMIGYFYQVRANARLDGGDEAGAFEDYDLAARLNPSFMLTYNNRGRAHFLAGHYAEALADYEHALALDPTYPDASYGLGLALLALARPAEAVRAFDRVIERQGPVADVLHAKGLAYAELGRYGHALDAYSDALALEPDMVLVYQARGALHEQRGEIAQARADYMAFLRLAPGTPDAPQIPAVRERLDLLVASL